MSIKPVLLSLLSFATATALSRVGRADEAPPPSISIVDGVTLEPIPNATFEIDREHRTATAVAPGYEASTQDLPRGNAPTLVLLFKTGVLDEVVQVHAQAPHASTSTSYTLTADEIRNLPGGGNDALSAVRSLPGVGSAPMTAAGRLVIRGGAPQDSLLTIDGIPVPFVYHAFDNTTILPVQMVGAMTYSPGGFGVEEGRATSGTVEILTSDIAPTRPTAQGTLSLLDLAATGATPLVDHLYLSGGVRRSTVDLLLPLVASSEKDVGFTTPPRYYDAQLRLDWVPSSHDRLTLMGLTSYDRLGVVNHMADSDLPSDFASDTEFARAIATWKHESGAVRNRLVGALGDSALHATFDSIQHVNDAERLAILRDDLSIAASERITVRAGAIGQLEHHDLDARSILVPADGLPPGHFEDIPVQTIATGYDRSYAAAYVSADFKLTPSTTVTAGTRLDYFARIDAAVVEPRIAIAQRVGELTLRAAAGRYARDPSQVEGLATDLSPERATQLSTAAEVKLTPGLSASATVYHTARTALAVDDPTQTDMLPYASTGTGTSDGVDLMLQAHGDHAFGWLAYSFGKTARRDTAESESHATPYDQTHSVTAVGSYAIGAWRFGGRAQFTTGLPYTDVVGATYSDTLGRYVPTLGAPYAARYPNSARVDLRVERVWQTKAMQLAAFVDVENVFRDARIQRYMYNEDFSMRQPLTEFVPLPSIGVRGEF